MQDDPENGRNRVEIGWGMHIRMRNAEGLTNSQINEFLKASTGIEFTGQSRAEVYATSFRTVVRVSMTIRYLIAGPAG
jgi:hypothetical protein